MNIPDRPWVYIAGPYTAPDVAVNVNRAITIANDLLVLGNMKTGLDHSAVMIIPHMSHFWHMIYPKDYIFWTEYDIYYMKKCDIIYRFPGESPGAENELRIGARQGLGIVYCREDYIDILVSWYRNRGYEPKPKTS